MVGGGQLGGRLVGVVVGGAWGMFAWAIVGVRLRFMEGRFGQHEVEGCSREIPVLVLPETSDEGVCKSSECLESFDVGLCSSPRLTALTLRETSDPLDRVIEAFLRLSPPRGHHRRMIVCC